MIWSLKLTMNIHNFSWKTRSKVVVAPMIIHKAMIVYTASWFLALWRAFTQIAPTTEMDAMLNTAASLVLLSICSFFFLILVCHDMNTPNISDTPLKLYIAIVYSICSEQVQVIICPISFFPVDEKCSDALTAFNFKGDTVASVTMYAASKPTKMNMMKYNSQTGYS